MPHVAHRIATFKPRRRRLSAARAELYDRLSPTLCLAQHGQAFDAAAVFGRSAPLVLDIGIGSGDALLDAALAEADIDVIGADIHTPGIAATLARIEELGLTNVRLLHGDALHFVERLAPGSLAGIRLYFPDPWPKARHRERRLINPANLDRFAALLEPCGFLHVATDIADYATVTERLCDAHPEFDGGVVPRPTSRPMTRYERKGLEQGRTATDLIFRRS